jgi:hypothetical protein
MTPTSDIVLQLKLEILIAAAVRLTALRKADLVCFPQKISMTPD